MSGNKALKKAIETKDVIRIGVNLPLIVDETILVTPTFAEEVLKKNKRNRPVNWRKVEQYSKIMAKGEWELHSQGIIMDENGNLLTGQNRLWAVIFADCNVYMRISRGNRATVASLLDRGSPQTARDLAARETERRHSPTEAMIARGMLALAGNLKPTADEIAKMIIKNSEIAAMVLPKTTGTKKTKTIIMILAAICTIQEKDRILQRILKVSRYADELEQCLKPFLPEKCWGKGTAFAMAMEAARKCVEKN